jgi:hypothetical protein
MSLRGTDRVAPEKDDTSTRLSVSRLIGRDFRGSQMAKVVFDSEQELEDYICEHLENNWNPIDGSRIHWYGRQVKLGPYGIIDLMTVNYDPDGSWMGINIIELKKDVITVKAIAQLARYIKGVLHYFEINDTEMDLSVSGQLVAPKFELSDDTVFLSNLVGEIEFYTIDFDLNEGISFKESAKLWGKTNPDFAEFKEMHGRQIIGIANEIKSDFQRFVKEQRETELTESTEDDFPGNSGKLSENIEG